MAGIYLHVPFCRKACHYCDFHFSTSLNLVEPMVSAMVRELELKANRLENETVSTIYFGGGTPSLLSPKQLDLLLHTIHQQYKVSLSELTLEANPDDINTENLKAWKAVGVNRLSIGLQTFQNETLAWMNRIHSAEEGRKSVKMAQDAGFDNISLDLIFNIPGSTEKDLEKDIYSILDLNSQHISAYNLTIEPQTVFGKRKKKGELSELNDDQSANQFLLVRNTLQANDFQSYEVSNFAKPGKEASHNTNYWFQVPYLGIGPSAHGLIGRSKTVNPANNTLYIKSLQANQLPETTEEFSLEDLANEMILTRLRTKWGLDLDDLKSKTGIQLDEVNGEKIKQFERQNFLKGEKNRLLLTEAGILLADYVAMELMV